MVELKDEPDRKYNRAPEMKVDVAPSEAATKAEHKEPEEVSAILSRRAQEEAELCIAPDRSLDHVRLRAALLGGSDRLNKLLLGRLPYQVLLDLKGKNLSKIL